jgi:cytochrome c oxidase cbb3-type subunit 3
MSEVKRHDEIQGAILHEYDGIEEADNELPLWWLGIFYGTMAIAVVYWFAYHEYELLPTQNEIHAAYVAKQKAEAAKFDPSGLGALANDQAAVAGGAQAFQTNCIACHGNAGEGKIGPNLTDAFWIHGGGPADIHKTITDGVAAKGMPSWGAVLGPEKVKQLTAFVLSLRGKNLAGKAPEGPEWKGDGQGG